jgi:hypothetical protein
VKAFVVVLVLTSTGLGAQLRPEARAELVASRHGHQEAGLGLSGGLGPYLRAGVTVSYDLDNDLIEPRRVRIENQVRFLLDPLAQGRWGLSFGAGLGYRQRAYLVMAADLEGPCVGRVRPAIQFALGAGARLALIVRGARPNRR